MPFKISGKIEGLADVLRALDGVGKKVRKKALRKAVTKAARTVLWAAKATVKKKTGLLRRSLGQRIKVYRESGAVVGIVGPRTGFKQEVTRDGKKVLSNPTRYAHLVELGAGRPAAYPFLEPAFESNKEAIKDGMAEAIAKVIKESGS